MYGKLANGPLSLNTTVVSSNAVVPPGESLPVLNADNAFELLSGLTRRSIVATTSAAVTGEPSLNLAAGFSLNVHSDASAFGDHSAAIWGLNVKS